MDYNQQSSLIEVPAIGGSFLNWAKIIFFNRDIDLKYYPKVILVTLLNLIGVPFRFFESWKLRKRISRTSIDFPPVFIIGHWRSGTTHLHNLLCKDPQFGYITMLQASFPKSFMSNNFFKVFMKKFLPQTRPGDNMALEINSAQEEELALGNLFPHAFYNSWYFPKKILFNYFNYICFKNSIPKVKKLWKKVYILLLKKATLYMEGKRLVLKNPSNTARIRIILDLFPDAKFIHIYRNPYDVYMSTHMLYKKAIPHFMFHKITKKKIDYFIINIYKDMMRRYFEENTFIPKNNLIEIKYENLEKHPIEILKNIYDKLGLNGFQNAKQHFERYLEDIADYKKNIYHIDHTTRDKISKFWNFTITKWNYDAPQPMKISQKKPTTSMKKLPSKHDENTINKTQVI